MEQLSKMMVGTWNTSEEHAAGGILSSAATGKGTQIVKLGPGGLSLIYDYRAIDPRGEYTGHGIIYWDSKEHLYHAFWCDNFSPTGCELSGAGMWEGNSLILRSESEENGKKFMVKHTYTDITPNSFTYIMDISEDDGPMKRFMTVRYTRVGRKNPR